MDVDTDHTFTVIYRAVSEDEYVYFVLSYDVLEKAVAKAKSFDPCAMGHAHARLHIYITSDASYFSPDGALSSKDALGILD